ncbi:hypothetical protein COV11_03210 [Candidatus Woesearchaeota archaeon CG10_big_fil_rev_8_21_14_0_10_30_7]|nr:MAG: hypothetical protein COV11_03210 [Candidatus Woesearchaeota archaeon CG10_big_fil_rev_8_21_14_0_10_30_7]
MSNLEEQLRAKHPELKEAWDKRVEKLVLYRQAVVDSEGRTGPGTKASVMGDYFSQANGFYNTILDAVIKKEVGLEEL